MSRILTREEVQALLAEGKRIRLEVEKRFDRMERMSQNVDYVSPVRKGRTNSTILAAIKWAFFNQGTSIFMAHSHSFAGECAGRVIGLLQKEKESSDADAPLETRWWDGWYFSKRSCLRHSNGGMVLFNAYNRNPPKGVPNSNIFVDHYVYQYHF